MAVTSCVKTRTGHVWCLALGSEAPGEHPGNMGLQLTCLRPREQVLARPTVCQGLSVAPQEMLEDAKGGHR